MSILKRIEHPMKNRNTTIVMLSCLALVMIAVHLLLPEPASAQVAIKERDYQLVTASVAVGGDGLYILDNRTGQVAIFTYDLSSKSVKARTVQNVAEIFNPR
jgi:predicted tellurium resistance membrane protein TerC